MKFAGELCVDPGLLRRDDSVPDTHAVRSLALTNFRNYAHVSLETEGKSVALYGQNGAGKTNLLEAISLLSPGRGFRRARLSEMDAISGGGPWVVSAEITGKIGEVQIGTSRQTTPPPHSPSLPPPRAGEAKEGAGGIKEGSPQAGGIDRRIVRVNGSTLKSPNQLSEYLSVIWLTPQMDMLFLEGGTARRKFLDRLVYGFDPLHATRVNRYELAMRERNKLLTTKSPPFTGGYGGEAYKNETASPPYAPPASGGGNRNVSASGGGNLSAWLDSLESQMAADGTAIAFARAEAVAHINQVMQMSTLDFPKAHLSLVGMVEDAVNAGALALDVELLFRKALHASRAEDAQAGRTLVGVHRAELTVMHTLRNMEAAHCSTGEQKALLLAIILAEARSASLWHGHVPVVLLDEVAAHLDPKKRHELYMELQSLNAQVWMTGVSRDLFEEMHDNCVFFRVEEGRVSGDV